MSLEKTTCYIPAARAYGEVFTWIKENIGKEYYRKYSDQGNVVLINQKIISVDWDAEPDARWISHVALQHLGSGVSITVVAFVFRHEEDMIHFMLRWA
jgi:hypothetical protein